VPSRYCGGIIILCNPQSNNLVNPIPHLTPELSPVGVTIRWAMDWILGLFSTLTHTS
jgi:hypothetical protein